MVVLGGVDISERWMEGGANAQKSLCLLDNNNSLLIIKYITDTLYLTQIVKLT